MNRDRESKEKITGTVYWCLENRRLCVIRFVNVDAVPLEFVMELEPGTGANDTVRGWDANFKRIREFPYDEPSEGYIQRVYVHNSPQYQLPSEYELIKRAQLTEMRNRASHSATMPAEFRVRQTTGKFW